MSGTVVDIPGKGFKFEQEIQEIIPPVKTGTVAVFIGGAHWGEKNTPTRIKRGRGEFKEKFGPPVLKDEEVRSDSSSLAAWYHLKHSNDAFFTRVSDGTDTKARLDIISPPKKAKIIGNSIVKFKNFTIPEDGRNKIVFNNISNLKSTARTIVIPPSPKAILNSRPLLGFKANGEPEVFGRNYNPGQKIQLTIDNDIYTKIVNQGDNWTNLVPSQITGSKQTYEIKLVLSSNNTNINENDFNTYNFLDNNNISQSSIALLFQNKWLILTSPQGRRFGIWFKVTQNDNIPNVNAFSGLNYYIMVDLFSLISSAQQNNQAIYWEDILGKIFNDLKSTPYFKENPSPNENYFFKITKNSSASNFLNRYISIESKYVGFVEEYQDSGTYTSASTEASQGAVIKNINNTPVSIEINSSSYEFDFRIERTVQGTFDNASFYPLKWINTAKNNIFGLKTSTGTVYNGNNITVKRIDNGPNSFKAYILEFVSNQNGSNSTVKLFESIANIGNSNLESVNGSNTSINTIIDIINQHFNNVNNWDNNGPVNAVCYIDLAGYIVFETIQTGPDQNITINVTPNSNDSFIARNFLGFNETNNSNSGSIELYCGSLEAKYTGSLGNTIKYIKRIIPSGHEISFIFDQKIVAKFLNYSYFKNDDNYIGKLIRNNQKLNEILNFIEPTDSDGIPFPVGEFSLSGGSSGIANIPNTQYILELEKYKATNIYEFDILCVSGNVSPEVQDKMIEVCEFRKDALAIIDPPFGLNPDLVIAWHNGLLPSMRDKKIDSYFAAIYYPWVLIPIGDSGRKEWHPPSVRVVGTIAKVDSLIGNKYSAVAGINATLEEIEALEYYVSEEEQTELYADLLKNNINPIVYTISNGFFIDGQKTAYRRMNAFNRINTARVAFHIKREISKIVPRFFFTPGTPEIWRLFETDLIKIFAQLQQDRAIKPNWVVKCDSSTNTPEIIESHGMLAICEWSPIKSVERIKVISTMVDQVSNIVFETE